jgi:hypothetical protein
MHAINSPGDRKETMSNSASREAAKADTVAAARFATARFLSGQYGLHAGFVRMLHRSGRPPALRASPQNGGDDQTAKHGAAICLISKRWHTAVLRQ